MNGTEVLNALRHQRTVHGEMPPPSDSTLACSTPYGIRGLCIRLLLHLFQSRNGCSTPYGIRGLCMRKPVFLPGNLLCRAQRLTASEDCALVLRWPNLVLLLTCSTPYGIRGLCILWSARSTSIQFSAQRLTASEDCASCRQPHKPGNFFGAQRLTASEDCASIHARIVPS